MSVSELTSEAAQLAFDQRRQDVLATARHFDLYHENIIVVGGAGLALHGLDSYVENRHPIQFDIDVVDVPSRDHAGRSRFLNKILGRQVQADHFNVQGAPLELTHLHGDVHRFFGYANFRSMVSDRVIIGGLGTLPVASLVWSKLDRGLGKDYAGIIKAHMIALNDKHPIVQTADWRQAVQAAVGVYTETWTEQLHRTWVNAPWLQELIDASFDHPAFVGLTEPIAA